MAKIIKKLQEEIKKEMPQKVASPLTNNNHNPSERISQGNEKIDTSQFKPLSSEELVEILGLTIKKDEENKLVTFLCQLSAYTEDSQFNTSFNAPSSTGKSHIPIEIAILFPKEDVKIIGYASPTSFYHDHGAYIKESNTYEVDLERKILVFLDQPHPELLKRLRPLLSHDQKDIAIKITDKKEKFGTKTKNIILKGYPAVIFCSAGLRLDEQEMTRMVLLSPEISQEKIREGIELGAKKEADLTKYNAWLEADERRKRLKQRVLAIKYEGVQEIRIPQIEKVLERFFSKHKRLKPRDQRDIKRLCSFIKMFALLNLWWRPRQESVIEVSEEDINKAFALWDKISKSQELNLPPYVYSIFQEVILPAWNDKNILGDNLEPAGISRQEILQKHFEVYGRMMDSNQLRQQILPMLEIAGLINQEQDPHNRRRMLIYLTNPSDKF